MLEIYALSNPDQARSLRLFCERIGAKEAPSVDEARRIEESGNLAFVDETSAGQNCVDFEERMAQTLYSGLPFDEQPRSYNYTYIEPTLENLCRAAKAWYGLRGAVVQHTMFTVLVEDEGSYWVRKMQNGFMQNGAPAVLTEYEPLEGCECDKKARVLQIKRLLGLESIDQGSIESRTQITSRYTDLEQLLGLNPEAPQPPTVITFIPYEGPSQN